MGWSLVATLAAMHTLYMYLLGTHALSNDSLFTPAFASIGGTLRCTLCCTLHTRYTAHTAVPVERAGL